MFKGLYSLIYPSNNLQADKVFWTKILGIALYFDEPFYVGFSVGGNELGLDPMQVLSELQYQLRIGE